MHRIDSLVNHLDGGRHAQSQAPPRAQRCACRGGWQAAGRARALALPNRGPIKLTKPDARLDPSILQAIHRYGFYVFTGPPAVANPPHSARVATCCGNLKVACCAQV